MMKKGILIITLIYASCFNCSSQVNSLLQKALAKYSQTQSFACECFVATDVPINFSFSCKMEASRNPLDTICGFYYYIKYVPGDNTADFSLYNGSDAYMSYKGKITQINRLKKPDAFKDKVYNAGKSLRPSVVSSPTMFSFSLFEIENNIRKDLNDSTLKFVARNDTVIDMVNCFQFSFRKADMIKQICIEKESLLPKYICSTTSGLFNQTQTALFKNFDVSKAIPLTYYLAENRLPANWEANLPKEIKIDMTGKKAPGWTLPVLNNESALTLNQLKGKVILLEFTATWCIHCIEAAEMMKSLDKKLKGNPDIVLLSVFSSSADDKEKILKFAEKHQITNKVLYDAKTIGDTYQVNGYPTFFIIDNTGSIIKEYRGYGEGTEQVIIGDLTKLGKPLGDRMRVVDDYQNINSLKDCVQSFKGKKVYVDVWATWCRPCIEEFGHQTQLKELLKSGETEILYISLDKENDDAKWKEMIKLYNLEGKHIRANKNLVADLTKIKNQNGIIDVPWYILMDEKGNILKRHAKKPSELEELKKELQEN